MVEQKSKLHLFHVLPYCDITDLSASGFNVENTDCRRFWNAMTMGQTGGKTPPTGQNGESRLRGYNMKNSHRRSAQTSQSPLPTASTASNIIASWILSSPRMILFVFLCFLVILGVQAAGKYRRRHEGRLPSKKKRGSRISAAVYKIIKIYYFVLDSLY